MKNLKLSLQTLLVILVVFSVWRDTEAQTFSNTSDTTTAMLPITTNNQTIGAVTATTTAKSVGSTLPFTGSTILLSGCVALLLHR
jgi:hypothetical protein